MVNPPAKEKLRHAAVCAWVQEIMKAAREVSAIDRTHYSQVLGMLKKTTTDLQNLATGPIPVRMTVMSCEDDSQCPDGQICDIGTGTCMDPLP